jgi:hypothetical protein
MSLQNSLSGPNCEALHALTDTFLDSELDCDNALEFTRHMAECPELSRLVAGRKAMRARLRAAVRTVTASPGLETRIRARVNEQRTSRSYAWSVLAVAAVVLLAVGVTNFWRTGGLRFTPASQEAYIDSLRAGVSPVMQVGLQQHVHCAVYRKMTSPFPTAEEMARTLGHDDADLVPAMQRHLPSSFRVVLAHRCNYDGRPYIHLAATDGHRLISLLITNRAQGEAFENDLRAVATEADAPLYTSSIQRFTISGFETRDHLVYMVSDLDPGQNLSAFEAMVPDVARTIRTHEI